MARGNIRRVVVTGLGLVTPLGTGTQHVWGRLVAGHSGITSLQHLAAYKDIPSQIAGLVPRGSKADGGFDINEWVPKSESRNMSMFIQYAMSAAKQALDDSGYRPQTDEERWRTGVCFGSGIGSLDDIESTSKSFNEQGLRRVSPFFIPRILINLPAGHIALSNGLQGPNHSVSTACTTGAHSLGDAYRFILHSDADVMVAGGTEASTSPLAMAGFARARALSTAFNHEPTRASRPFDKDRDGFVIGEGAGAVVLEELEHARKRGAKIYAEILGYGLSCDAHHITAPPDDGNGARRAMARALETAQTKPEEVGYINAHATGTGLGDIAETRAIISLFPNPPPVSATKASIGHLLGAAGAVESIFTILALHDQVLPPTINLENPDPECTLDYVPLKSRSTDGLRRAVTNSFGFGGTNASLVFGRWEDT
ncbi:Mitochondrial beta-keto-acyl synthase [Gaertneriomyces sp. JEL0708]|nr:Mitochondrial beta-keto-acyl synthase [Gaertneriomyces sp. JEL0708]